MPRAGAIHEEKSQSFVILTNLMCALAHHTCLKPYPNAQRRRFVSDVAKDWLEGPPLDGG